MTRKKKTYWWFLFLVCALALFFKRSDALAHMEKPEVRVGYVCIEGLSVQLFGNGSHTSKDRPSALDWNQCRPPGIPDGLPGKFVFSSRTVDGNSGVAVVDLDESTRKAVDSTASYLVKHGYSFTRASELARDRNSLLPSAELISNGKRLHVVGTKSGVGVTRVSIVSLEEAEDERSLP